MLTPDFSLPRCQGRRLRAVGRALNRASLPVLFIATALLVLVGGWHSAWWLAAHAHWTVGIVIAAGALVDAAIFAWMTWRDVSE